MPLSPEESTATRRGFLDWIIYSCSTILGGTIILPAVAYLWPVTKSGPVKVREEIGEAANWNIWGAKKVSVGNKPVLVIRTDKGFVAFSAVCTHLGCLVEFNPVKQNIICPCHAASFDIEGKVEGGPPPRPLAAYKVSEVQGKVFVST
ncbi:MAG: Rieske (2Fe-2S) protein [Planctomycetota bacterium]|nr:MAG: Rieske (2Fe-2S) protein [Planctomycetota bacterium]